MPKSQSSTLRLFLMAVEAHQLFPGGDLKFGENVIVNFGIGFGATEAGNRLIYKMRIGYLFRNPLAYLAE